MVSSNAHKDELHQCKEALGDTVHISLSWSEVSKKSANPHHKDDD